MGCRGRAGCRPGRTDHGERGRRSVRAEQLVAARQGPMPAEGRGACRSPRSSPRAGKPSTWRRRTAGPRQATPFGRSGVNTPAPLSAKEAEQRVLGWQTKLHRWAAQDGQKRFGDLFNLVCDPATLLVAWERVKRNRGSQTAGVDGQTRRRPSSCSSRSSRRTSARPRMDSGPGAGRRTRSSRCGSSSTPLAPYLSRGRFVIHEGAGRVKADVTDPGWSLTLPSTRAGA
jgi:hypothetical protein